jgi:hypothetical protein
MTFRWTRRGSATFHETAPRRPSPIPSGAADGSDHAVGQNRRCRRQAGLRSLCRSRQCNFRCLPNEIPVSPAGVALADTHGDSKRSRAVRARKAACDPTA